MDLRQLAVADLQGNSVDLSQTRTREFEEESADGVEQQISSHRELRSGGEQRRPAFQCQKEER